MRIPSREASSYLGACFILLWLEDLGRIPKGTSPILARDAMDWKAVCDEHGFVANDALVPQITAVILSEKIEGLEDPEVALAFAHAEVHYLRDLM